MFYTVTWVIMEGLAIGPFGAVEAEAWAFIFHFAPTLIAAAFLDAKALFPGFTIAIVNDPPADIAVTWSLSISNGDPT